MISLETPLVLGSASPRRRELLTLLKLPLRIVAVDIDETPRPEEPPDAYLERVVRDKLAAVFERTEDVDHGGLVVGDTIVIVDGDVLGKPADVPDAERLLQRIAGRAHLVRTRYALGRPGGALDVACERTVESRVTLRAATRDELRRYAETGEGLDKAGAYAAQGIGAFLVQRIEGSYSNVVGLPICELVRDLVATGLLRHFP
jgi:nucleoside triphosphate pyrophosphatase